MPSSLDRYRKELESLVAKGEELQGALKVTKTLF